LGTAKEVAADTLFFGKLYAKDKANEAKEFAVDKVDDAKVWAKENPQLAVAAAAGVGVTALTAGMAFLSHLKKGAAYRKANKTKKNGKSKARHDRRDFEQETRGLVPEDFDEEEFIEYLEAFLDELDA
jgi:hypothetical protein